jgi:beta-lactamase class D
VATLSPADIFEVVKKLLLLQQKAVGEKREKKLKTKPKKTS